MKVEGIAAAAGLSLVVAIGLVILSFGLRNLWRANASKGWPTASGVVESSETNRSVSTDSSTHASSASYAARIRVRYQVAGRDYNTDVVRFGQTGGSGDSSEAELQRLRYPVGATVTVSYHSKDPSIAAVRPGIDSDALWLPGAGLGFLLPGIMFIVLYYRGSSTSGLKGGMILFSMIFGLIGMAMLAGGLGRLWNAYASTRWPLAPGVITYGRQDASTSVSKDSDGDERRSTVYGVRLVYEYEVDGRKHFNNVRVFGQLAGSSDSGRASSIAQQYPLGKKVDVAYDPADPDIAALEPGIDNEAYWLPGAGAAFLLFGLAVYFFGIPALTSAF